MGLDVSGYKNLVEVATLTEEDERFDEMRSSFIMLRINKAFPGRAEGIKEYTFYNGTHIRGPSLPYSAYGQWRNDLAKLAGYKNEEYEHSPGFKEWSYCKGCWFDGVTGPFSEQIDFSDCEGTLGPIVCAKLAKDYEAFDEQAKALGDQFYKTYSLFRELFSQTEGLVAVEFH